ncbi:MAG: MFS transporter [Paracoccaceae bacterium]
MTIRPEKFSPNLRVMAFFFAQSMSVGLANSFAGIWFGSRGLSAAEIGVINALPILLLLFISLSVGRLADRASDWRQVIVIGAVLSSLFPVGLFFVNGFSGVLVFWTLAVIAQWAIVPVADAAALRMARRDGADFGTFRAWGTIGYLLVILAAGFLIDGLGIEVFLPLFVGLCLVRSLSAFGLPRMRAEDAVVAKTPGRMRQVMKPWFLLPLVGWAMVYSTHLVLNAFQGLLWAEQGIAAQVIGLLIGLGAVAETVMFFAFRRFAGRFSPLSLIFLAAVVSVVRWVAMSFAPDVPVLVGLQLLHSVIYALGFLACTNFIADSTSEDIAAEAQSFLVVLEQGLAVVALLAFGWLAGMFGAGAYLGSAAMAILGGVLVWVARRRGVPPSV